jgi:replicative DNA helicase
VPERSSKIEAELNIVGYVFLHSRDAQEVFERIPKSEMFTGINQSLWACFRELVGSGQEITAATVMVWFERKQNKAPADLLTYLMGCAEKVECVLPETVFALCKIVTDSYYARMFQVAAAKVTSLDDAMKVSERVFALAGEKKHSQRPLGVVLDEILARQEAIYAGTVEAGYSWGVPSMDKLLLVRPGCLYTVGGIKKGGKSLFLLSILDHNLRQAELSGNRCPELFFSLEMSDTECMLRLLSRRAKVDSNRLFTRYLGRDEYQRIQEATDSLRGVDLVIEDAASLSLADILVRARVWKEQMKVEDGTGIIGVDFLQLIVPEQRKRELNRAEELKEQAYSLARLAKSLKVAVIQLAQLHNAAEGEKPRMRNLEGSGAIAQASEGIILLDLLSRREDDVDKTAGVQPMDIIIEGQRRGASGETIHCQAHLAHGEFFEEERV